MRCRRVAGARPPERPARTASISASIESAVSAGDSAPMSRPAGPLIRSRSALGHARLEQQPAAALLVPARAERADVERLALERGLQHRQVELVVVGEHDDRGADVGLDGRDRLVGPRDEQLVGARDPLARREAGAGVGDDRRPAEQLRRRGRAPRRCRSRRRRGGAAAGRRRRRRASRRRARSRGCGRVRIASGARAASSARAVAGGRAVLADEQLRAERRRRR